MSTTTAEAPPRKPRSKPEVFIIESLSFENEEDGMFEGRILADVLRMCGKKPAYYYFRTSAELKELMQRFKESEARYLHVSCHGSVMTLRTTLETLSLVDFAEITKGYLTNKRLFLSACSFGSELSAEVIKGRNPRIYSIAAPEKDMRFTYAVAFWSSFYVKLFEISGHSMSDENVEVALCALCKLFNTPFYWTYRVDEKWHPKQLKGD